jgi:hypothetical protein
VWDAMRLGGQRRTFALFDFRHGRNVGLGVLEFFLGRELVGVVPI